MSKTPLRPFFEEVRPQEGTRRTLNVAIFFYHKGLYLPIAGPIMRLITDMKDDDKVLSILDTGQVMRKGSPYVSSMMDMFHNGEYIQMPTPKKGSKWPQEV